MTIDRVSIVQISDDSSGLTLSTPPHVHGAGNALVVAVSFLTDDIPAITISDTAGDIFVLVSRVNELGVVGCLAVYCAMQPAGAAANVVTMTLDNPKTKRRMQVVELTGLGASGNIIEAKVSGSGTGPMAFSSPYNTENLNDILMIAVADDDDGGGFAAGTDYTLESSSGNLAVADRIVSDAQTNTIGSIMLGDVQTWVCIAFALADTGVVAPAAIVGTFALVFEVDWTNTGVWVDETARLLDLNCRRGRNKPNPLNGRSAPGTLTAILDNRSGRFSHLNAGSGIAGQQLPARQCRLRFTTPSSITRWRGYVKQLLPSMLNSNTPIATLTAEGPLSRIAGKKISPPADAGSLDGTVINEILDAVNWPGTNLCTNGDFEVDATGWTPAGTNTIARSTTQKKFNLASAALTYNNGLGGDSNCGAFHLVATAATPITVSFWCFVPAAYSGAAPGLSAEGFVGATGVLNSGPGLSFRDQWVQTSFTFTPAAGDLVGDIVARLPTAPNGSVVYIDGVQIERGNEATTNFNRRQVDAGQVTMSRWFVASKDAMDSLREIEESGLGFMLEYGNGDIGYQDKSYRQSGARTTAQATYSDAPGATLPFTRGITELDALADICNDVQISITPYTVNALAVLWTLSETPTLSPGQSRTWIAQYPSQGSGLGGRGAYVETWQTPVIGTDVTQSGVANGDIAITYSKNANQMTITVKNNHATNTATLTLVQAQGTAVVKGTAAIVSSTNAASVLNYGTRTLRNPPQWLPSTNAAQDLADGINLTYKDPVESFKVPFLANMTPALFTELINRELSDRIALVATQPSTALGVTADCFVEAIEDHYDVQRGRYEISLEVSQAAAANTFWVVGTSVLGTGTVLGF